MNDLPIKYQVFISSTYQDLIEERREAIETILSMYHFPVGMEMFSADNEEQWKVIQNTIDTSDIYILIIGHRYGSLTKRDKISFTKKEFDYAKKRRSKNGLEMLCFIRERNVLLLPEFVETDIILKQKLDRFINEIKNGGFTVKSWRTPADLGREIGIAVSKTANKMLSNPYGSRGWIKREVSVRQQHDLETLDSIKKFLHTSALNFETINDDVETYKIDSRGNCIIERVRTQLCNSDITHNFTKYVMDEEGHSSVMEIVDLQTGKNLDSLIYDDKGCLFSFFVLFNNFLHKGDSIRYKCKVKAQGYLANLIKSGVGYVGYEPFSKTSFSNKRDIFIFPNNNIFSKLTVTLIQKRENETLNIPVSFITTKGNKIFTIDYGNLGIGSAITVEFRIK